MLTTFDGETDKHMDTCDQAYASLSIPLKTQRQVLRTLIGAKHLVQECKKNATHGELSYAAIERALGPGGDFSTFCTEVSSIIGENFDPYADNAMEVLTNIPESIATRLSSTVHIHLRSLSLHCILLEAKEQIRMRTGERESHYGTISIDMHVTLKLPRDAISYSLAELPGAPFVSIERRYSLGSTNAALI